MHDILHNLDKNLFFLIKSFSFVFPEKISCNAHGDNIAL